MPIFQLHTNFQHFPRSRSFAHICSAQSSQCSSKFFATSARSCAHYCKHTAKFIFFAPILMTMYRNSRNSSKARRENHQDLLQSAEISWKLTPRKNADEQATWTRPRSRSRCPHCSRSPEKVGMKTYLPGLRMPGAAHSRSGA